MASLAGVGRWTLLRKFTLLSLVCFTLLGLALSQLLANRIHQRALSNTTASAQLLSDVAIRTRLSPGDFAHGVPPNRLRGLDAAVRQARDEGGIARVKVWSRAGTIVYSDKHAEIGKHFEVEKALSEAFGGKQFVDVAHGQQAEQRGERGIGPLLEAYVPLRFGAHATPAGAFELYLPYAPVQRAVAHDVHLVYALVAGGMAVLFLLLFRIVARASRSLRRQAAKSRHQALHDSLTGLPNRRCLYQRLDEAIDDARRQGTSVALLLGDLDGFKELNDTLGHHVGDMVLSQLGPRLQDALPEGTLLARLGGDEFAMVVTSSDARGEGRAAAESFRAALGQPFAIDDISLAVQASIGISYFPDHGDDANALLRRADVAMYWAKAMQAGWEEYTPERDGHSRARLALAGQLRRAISDGELVVHYQPKADLSSASVTSVEALVRWQHPEHGLLAPAEFVPMAEQTDLIRPLTLFVLDEALQQASEWEEMGLDLGVAVNLAMPNLLDSRLPDDVAKALAKTKVSPRRLTLEITENAVMIDPVRVTDVLRRLRSLGVGLSLDDFGTGHSSLAYLKELAIDELKIDRSFVQDMAQDGQNAAIVRSTIELAHAMGLRVVAEGVEDADTLFELKTMGADIAQGFYLSRPVPPIEIAAMLMHALSGNPHERNPRDVVVD